VTATGVAKVETTIKPVAPPVQPVVRAITLAIESVRDAVSLPVQTRREVSVAVGLGAFGPSVQAIVNAFATDIKPVVDPVATHVQTLLDAITAVNSVSGCDRRCEHECDGKEGRDAHGGAPSGVSMQTLAAAPG